MPRPWYENPYVWLGAAGLGAALYYKEGDQIASDGVVSTVKDIASRVAGNQQLTHGTYDAETGIVLEEPEVLRAAASLALGFDTPNDLYAISRMVRSEGPKQGTLRVHVALNDLAHLGWSSVLYLLTYSTDPARKGFYGAQYSPAVPPQYPHVNARRYATSKDPYRSDFDMVLKAVTDHEKGIDPTGGAIKFLDKDSMGVQVGSRGFDEVNREWTDDGLTAFTLPQYGDNLVLYKVG